MDNIISTGSTHKLKAYDFDLELKIKNDLTHDEIEYYIDILPNKNGRLLLTDASFQLLTQDDLDELSNKNWTVGII